MGLPLLISVLFAATACSATNYKLEGHLNSISADDVRHITNDRTQYLNYEADLRASLESLLPVKLDQLFISKFEIHGDGLSKESAIFHSSISTSLSRAEIVEAVGKSKDLTIFHIMDTDSISASVDLPLEADSQGVTSCANGGILLPNNTCICPSFFVGDQCQTIQCLHHGILDGNRCACPPGVYAINCESRSCAPGVKDNMDVSKQTFMLVVSQKISMAYVLNTLIAETGSLLSDINKADPNLIQNYILVTYLEGDNLYYMQKMFTADVNEFMNYLGGINVVAGNNQQPTNKAILTAQSFAPLMRSFSNIFVFADSSDSEATPVDYTYSVNSTELNVIQKTKAWRNRIVYLLSQTVQNKINSTGDSYDVYRRVSKATLGDIIVMDISEINKVIDPLMSYYRQNEIIAVRYGLNKDEKINLKADFEEQYINILITVDPTGEFPAVTGPAATRITPLVKGGLWELYRTTESIVSSISVKVGESDVNVRIWVDSGNTGIISYTTDPMVDVGTLSCMSELLPSATAAAIGFSNTMTLQWVDLSDGVEIGGVPVAGLARAAECTFPVAFPAHKQSCTPGAFGNRLTFITNNVVTTRIVPGFCAKLDHHKLAAFACLNGGTLRANHVSCICPHYWGGIHCQIPECTHFGTPNPFPGNGRPQCNCAYGYGGDFCEQLVCSAASLDNFDTSNRTLAIVIQSSMSQAFNNIKISTGITSLLADFNGADAFNEYVLTYYNTITKNGQPLPVLNTTKYSTPAAFQTALQSNNIIYQASQASSMDLFGALAKTISSVTYSKSAIFVFVDSPVSQNATLPSLIEAAVLKELEINIVITPPFNMPNLCMHSHNASQFASLAVKTGGNIINLCNKYGTYQTDPIVEFLTIYGSTHHHVENLVEDVQETTCTGRVNLYASDPSKEIYLFVNGIVTEHFDVSMQNTAIGDDVGQTPISVMPFLSVYKLVTSAAATSGYIVDVFKAAKTTDGQCNYRIVERTNVTVTLGFTPDPSTDSYSKSLFYATAIHPVLHISQPLNGDPRILIEGGQSAGISYIGFGDDQRPSPCRYETFVGTPYACNYLNDYIVFSITYSLEIGETIQRSKRAYCFIPDGTCLNGGVMKNGRCDCTGLGYVGTHCEFPNCHNLQQEVDFQCQCSQDYTGRLCQYKTCGTWNFLETQDPRQGEYKQITFVLNINKDQLLPNIFLNNAMQQFIAESESSDLPKQYSLITFDQNKITNVISTSHTAQFLDIFNSTINRFTPSIATQTLAAEALNEAYKINIQPPEIIYLFTGTDTVTSAQASNSITKQRIGTQVNVIYTPQSVVYPQQPAGKNGYLLTFAARQSGGRVLPLTQYAVNGIDKLLASTIREDALIHDDAFADCSKGVTFSFNIESTFDSLVLDITGNSVNSNTSVTILDAGGKQVLLRDNSTLLSDIAAVVYQFKSSDVVNPGGLWKVNVATSSGSCFLQVRAKTNTRVIPGFTSAANSDFVKSSPFSDFASGIQRNSYMTFRVVDQPNFPGDLFTTLTSVTISATDYEQPWRQPKVLKTLLIDPRDPLGCANQFISQQWEMYPNTYQKFVVLGTDSGGLTFQRTFFYTILKNAADKAATCQSGTRNTYGECECDKDHNGDYCTDRRCQNGGSPSYGICVCNNGYYGEFCEKFLAG